VISRKIENEGSMIEDGGSKMAILYPPFSILGSLMADS